MKSSNPVLSEATYTGSAVHVGYGPTMTISGTVNKAGILMLFVLPSAAYTWNQFFNTRDIASMGGYTMIGAFGGFIVAMVTVFKKEWSPMTAPIYALLEGLFLGSLSATMELRFPGIAIESVALTFGTCFCLLLAYRSGIIRATPKFTRGIIAATGGIALVYFTSMVLGSVPRTGTGDIRRRADRHSVQSGRGDGRGAEPDSRFQHDRRRRAPQRPEVHGMVQRVRPDGHAGVAVSGDSPASR